MELQEVEVCRCGEKPQAAVEATLKSSRNGISDLTTGNIAKVLVIFTLPLQSVTIDLA